MRFNRSELAGLFRTIDPRTGRMMLSRADADFLSRVQDEIARLGRLTGDGSILVSDGPEGRILSLGVATGASGSNGTGYYEANGLSDSFPFASSGFFAKLRGSAGTGTSPYGFDEQTWNGSGWTTTTGGRNCNTCAAEATARPNLGSEIAYIYPLDSTHFYFQWIRAPQLTPNCNLLATVNGCCYTPGGTLFPGVTVSAIDSHGIVRATCTTGAGGTCTLSVFVPGTYTFKATHSSYQDLTLGPFNLTSCFNPGLTFNMQPVTGKKCSPCGVSTPTTEACCNNCYPDGVWTVPSTVTLNDGIGDVAMSLTTGTGDCGGTWTGSASRTVTLNSGTCFCAGGGSEPYSACIDGMGVCGNCTNPVTVTVPVTFSWTPCGSASALIKGCTSGTGTNCYSTDGTGSSVGHVTGPATINVTSCSPLTVKYSNFSVDDTVMSCLYGSSPLFTVTAS